MKKTKFNVGECSNLAIEHRSSEGVDDDLVLEPKHKIFLSHSGAQKEFVEHLHKALEDRFYYPFFDRSTTSLPKGEQFPSLIVKAVEECQLFVVVMSEEYFTSKWPMIELNAFIQAKKASKSNVNVNVLPLFYGLSPGDLKNEETRQRWLEIWHIYAVRDERVKVKDWCFAIDELTKFNGLCFDRKLTGIVAFEEEVVSIICKSVLPDIKWHDSHVQGNVHEVLFHKMNQIGLSRRYKVKVVGIHGVGGIGKTTTSKMLCNVLSSAYEGRVCHIEFDNACSNSKELLQNAVINLTKQSADFVRELGEGECKDVLYKNLHIHKSFLAIDNVWDNYNSIKLAQMFLDFPSHKESLVLVTARSQSTLGLLGIDGDACLEIPELEEADARSLFLHYAAPGVQFTTREDMDSIEWCVKKCYYCKGDGRGYHYHPLALEALGRQLRGFQQKPSQWKQHLSRVWKPWSFLGKDRVFYVLRSSFDLLQPLEQALFMDVGFFLSPIVGDDLWFSKHWIDWKEKLCAVYKRDELEIQSQLDSLKQKGLLQDADLTSRRITMHDLYRDLVMLEAIGKFGATTDMWDRKWVHVDGDGGDLSELEVTPAGGCWQKLSRLSIHVKKGALWNEFQADSRPSTNPIASLEGIEWQYFSNVLVLQLYGLRSIHGSLNLKGMNCLRSLSLYDFTSLESLEGLESLKHMACFDWEIHDSSTCIISKTHIMGQFPTSLRYLSIVGQCMLSGSNVLAHCDNLIKLRLVNVEVGVLLDLSNCSFLGSIEISGIKGLQTLSGLSATMSSGLHVLEIRRLSP